MRLAHLILAHKKPKQLERLIKHLMYVDTDIYIHLDKKENLSNFIYLASLPNVFFIDKRTEITWGDYSMVKATLDSFEQILNTSHTYSHINLLSGQDYPLKNAAEIQKFLFANTGKTFMKWSSIYAHWTEAILRLANYHFSDYNYPLKYKVQSLLNRILPKKELPNNLVAYGLSQWFTITPEHAAYVIEYLKEHRSVERFFNRTWGADELVFQTILLNSDLKSDITNDYLRYIKFTKGETRPRTLTIADAEDMVNSDKFYARKFDVDIDGEVLDHIDAKL